MPGKTALVVWNGADSITLIRSFLYTGCILRAPTDVRWMTDEVTKLTENTSWCAPFVVRKFVHRGYMLHACVVDKNIYWAKLCSSLVYQLVNAGRVSQISCRGQNFHAVSS